MTKSMSRSVLMCAAVLAVANVASAQVSSINSVVMHPRFYNDVPTAGLVSVNSYPSLISFAETNVSQPTGFANMDLWRFSNDGTTDYNFQNNDYFVASMDVNLTALANSPRKEAGFRLTTSLGGEGLFLVNTDAHEVVAVSGPFPFYAFPATFDSGETITLGLRYFMDTNTGLRSIVYSADGVDSPILPFTNVEQGIEIGTTQLGGYLQVENAPNDPTNSATAVFSNISISVPEPASMGLAAIGALAMIRRRR